MEEIGQKSKVGFPNPEEHFAELKLKLGIKSSLPNVRAAISLLISFWESGLRENGFVYGIEQGDSFVPSTEVVNKLAAYFGVQAKDVQIALKNNPLYTSQMEALQVAFELCWRIAKFEFQESSFPYSAERTGGKRYAKKISYTKNIDLVSLLVESDGSYRGILWTWIKQETVEGVAAQSESKLLRFLTAISEECVYRIRPDAENTYTFRNYGVYDALQDDEVVSIADHKEQVGPLRILTSIVADDLNYYFQKTAGGVILRDTISLDELARYSERVKNYVSLTDIRVTVSETADEQPDNQGDNAEGSVQWFAEQAKKLYTIDQEAEELYKEFLEHFAPEKLRQLSGAGLLDKMFLSNNKTEKNLCQILEYDSKYALFGSISGGNASKYGLYFSHQMNSWVTGGPKSLRSLTLEEAIALGTQIRDELVTGAKTISDFGEPTDLNGYAELYAQLFRVMPNLINRMWVLKYFHMIFPRIFPVFYNARWQNLVLEKVNIEPQEDTFVRMGQIALFAKECGISNVMFSKVVEKIERNLGDADDEEQIKIYDFNATFGGAQNKVIYGTPGCGKSYYVQNKLLPALGVSADKIIRTTFYQDYTNTEFVGQVLPKLQPDKSVTYVFNPGPFTLALRKAIEHPDEPVALVIEELNRGNAPSIFGDIFQLLDRDAKGKSQYEITNVNIQDYLNNCFEGQLVLFDHICIPSNLYIVATMNTSDQNVFTLDTAFKRRWQFEKIRNEFDASHAYKGYFVPGMGGLTWEHLVNEINKYILSQADGFTSEDKLIGVYFIEKDTLCEKLEDSNDERKKKRFAYKLFEYLWDDVAKFNREGWFGSEVKSLDQLIDAYMSIGKAVLKNVIKQD